MKTINFKITVVLLMVNCLISVNGSELYAQRKDTSDYFAIGVFGGSYIGQFPLYESNNIINTVGIELEYYKFTDLSFYVQGIYQFTGNNVRNMFKIPSYAVLNVTQPPETHRFNISFGGKYFLRNKNVNPFFELGINQEVNYMGKYSYRYFDSGTTFYYFNTTNYFFYRLSLNLGTGLSIKLNSKIKIELKYDLYKSLIRSRDSFTGFSFLAGLKYNL